MLHYNREELETAQKERLTELVEFAGGITFLSKMLNVPLPTVKGWIARERISKEGAKLVKKNESLNKKFTAEYLRPDLTK